MRRVRSRKEENKCLGSSRHGFFLKHRFPHSLSEKVEDSAAAVAMLFKNAFVHLSLLASVHASAIRLDKERRATGVQWGPCEVNGTLPVECGNITVPLDYTKPESTTTLVIGLLKVPATKEPKKGSILFNFGGPGFPARADLAALGKNLNVYEPTPPSRKPNRGFLKA